MPRTEPAPKPKPYVFQEHPKVMHPSTEMLAAGLKRTKTANSPEEEAALIEQGYQTTQADPPVVAPEMTKDQALEQVRAQFDASWAQKVGELAAANQTIAALQEKYDNLLIDRDTLAKRLTKLTTKPEAKKEGE